MFAARAVRGSEESERRAADGAQLQTDIWFTVRDGEGTLSRMRQRAQPPAACCHAAQLALKHTTL